MRSGGSLSSLRRRRGAHRGLVVLIALFSGALAMLAGTASGGAALKPEADLFIKSFSDQPDPVFTGAALTYTVEVGNHGPAAATRVILTVGIPQGATFRSADTSQGQCELRKAGRDHVFCRIGRVEPGATVTVHVHLSAPAVARTYSTRAFVESAKGGTRDPDSANNRRTEHTSVAARPPRPACKGEPATRVGTNGDDVLIGNPGNNTILALGGDDRILPDGGNDLVCAGPGDDLVRAGSGADRVYGGPGHDRVRGEGDDDVLRGGPKGDVMKGGAGGDVLRGRRGLDTLRGKDGADVVRGGRGADTLFGGRGADILVGGRGNDHCHGGAGHDTTIRC
jgi:uncharacterized repeat protein (TIGR01451 family)